MKLSKVIGGILLAGLASCKGPEVKQVVYQGDAKNAIIDNILTRRSIRKYTEQQVSQGQLDTIMKCAIFAPSAINKQPWEIRVVQNKKILEEMDKRFFNYAEGKALNGHAADYKEPGFSIFYHAPTVIVIAGDKANPNAKLDIGINLQNILLASKGLGLGTCPLGMLAGILERPENEDIKKLLNIPDDYAITICVALGYPAESPEAPIRYPDRVKIIQ